MAITRQIIATPDYIKSYQRLSKQTQKIVDTKIKRLVSNAAHPSLQTHRLKRAKAENVWGCYISFSKRLIYQYKDGKIYLWDVGEHSIVEQIHLRTFQVC